MSPTSMGKEMIPESIPHALSLLYFQFGKGRISELNVEWAGPEEMTIRFRYLFRRSHCEVFIKLVRKEKQPRDFEFGFNYQVVNRSLDLRNYAIYFRYGNEQLKIADPLELSVVHFMEAVKQKNEPFMGYAHILNNLSLLKRIYDGCQPN